MGYGVLLAEVIRQIYESIPRLIEQLDAQDEASRQKAAGYLAALATALSQMAASLEKGERPTEAGRRFKDLLSDFRAYAAQQFTAESVDTQHKELERMLSMASGIDWHLLKPSDRPAAVTRYGKFLNLKLALDPDADHSEWIRMMKRTAGSLEADAIRIANLNPDY